MRHKKKFINKKNATVYKLIPKDESKETDELEKLCLKVNEDEETRKKRLEQQIKYGVYFDDEYNYLQHLRERQPTSTMVLADEVPELAASVREFSRSVRDDTGEDDIYESVILDMEPPAPIQKPEFWDEEIEEALKNPSFDHEELEDDFFVKANEGSDLDKRNPQFEDAEMDDEEGDFYEEDGEEEEEEERMDFTNVDLDDYAMQRMLKVFEDSEEEEEGEEKPAAPATNPASTLGEEGWCMLNKAVRNICQEGTKLTDDLKEFTLQLCQSAEEKEGQLVAKKVVEPVRKSESLPSWPPPSRASNHIMGPKLIDDRPAKKIPLDPRTGIPKAVTLGRLRELEAVKDPRELATLDSLGQRLAQECTLRPRGETPEEKRERKATIKKYNRERRMEKKANKMAMKQEEVKYKKMTVSQGLSARVIKLA